MLRRYIDLPREIHWLCLGVLINRSGMFLLPLLSVYLADRLGLGARFATTAIGLFGAGAIVGAIVGGHVADHVGRKVTMLAALFGGAAVMLVFGTLTSPGPILIASFALPMVAEMYRPASQAFIADVVDPVRRPDAFALNYITVNLGAAIGPLIAGVVAEISYAWIFWGDAATTAACAILLAVAIPETLRRRGAAPPVARSGSQPIASGVGPLDALRRILRDHVFLLFCFGTALVAVVYLQCMSTFPLYLKSLGLGPRPYTRLIALNGALIVAFQLFVNLWVTRFDRGTMLALAAFLTAIGFGLKPFMTLEWHFAVCVLIWTTGEMMSAPLVGPVVADLAPIELRARYMACVTIAFSGAHVVAAPLGGMILESRGGPTLWATTFVVAACAALIFVAIRRRIAPSAAVAATPAASIG